MLSISSRLQCVKVLDRSLWHIEGLYQPCEHVTFISVTSHWASGNHWSPVDFPHKVSVFRKARLWHITACLSWWRHQMKTFSTLLVIRAGNSPVTGEFPTQRPVTRSFEVFFDLRLNKRLSKQWWGWCIETPSRSLWITAMIGLNISAAPITCIFLMFLLYL